MRTPRVAIAFLVLAAAALGCGGHHTTYVQGPPPPPPPGPRTLAILPFANTTASVDGPEVLRGALAGRVSRRGYEVQSLGDTDERLRGIGITLGGQLAGVKISELRKALGTDAAIGGTLIKHSNVVLGVANQQTLEAELMLIDLTNGHILYRERRKIVDKQDFVSGRGNGASALLGGAIGVASGVSRNSLKVESDKLAAIFAGQLPPPGAGYPPVGAASAAVAEAPTPTPAPGTAAAPAPTPDPNGTNSWPGANAQPGSSPTP